MNQEDEVQKMKDETMNETKKVDVKTIDSLLEYQPEQMNSDATPFNSFLSFDNNFSTVVDSINKLKQDLNEKNFMKEFSEMIIVDETIKVPFFGWFGKTLGIYKNINQQTEEKIVTKLGLEEAMPRIIDNMNSMSRNLGDVTNKLKDVIKSRNKYISKMESEVLDHITSYNGLKLKCDQLVEKVDLSIEQVSALDDYLSDLDYRDENFCNYEIKRTKLNKHAIELKKNGVILKKVVEDEEKLKKRIETSMCKAIVENQGLELYAKTANYVIKLVDQQNRESNMSVSAVYSVASQLTQVAYIGGEMIKQNKLNLELTDSLKLLSTGFKEDKRDNIAAINSIKVSMYDKVKGFF